MKEENLKMNKQMARSINAHLYAFELELSEVLSSIIHIRSRIVGNESLEIKLNNIAYIMWNFLQENEETILKISVFADDEKCTSIQDLERKYIGISKLKLEKIIKDCSVLPEKLEADVKNVIEEIKDLGNFKEEIGALNYYLSTSIKNSKFLYEIIKKYYSKLEEL